MANLGVMAALAGRGELVLLDRLSHASIIDGALLSGARFKRYTHGDATAAERMLNESPEEATVLATDGVFSMDGDVAPLQQLAKAAKARNAWLVVDDAHGIGVLGNTGRGSVEHCGVSTDDVPVLVGTLGKALRIVRRIRRRLARPHRVSDSEGASLHLHDRAASARSRRHAKGVGDRAARTVAPRTRVGAHRTIPQGGARGRHRAARLQHADPTRSARKLGSRAAMPSKTCSRQASE